MLSFLWWKKRSATLLEYGKSSAIRCVQVFSESIPLTSLCVFSKNLFLTQGIGEEMTKCGLIFYSILDRDYESKNLQDGSKEIFVKDLLDIKVLPSSVVIRGLPDEHTYVAHPVSGKTEEQTSTKLKEQGLWSE